MSAQRIPRRRTGARLIVSVAAIAATAVALSACSSGGSGGGDSSSGGTVTIGSINTFNQPGSAENATDQSQGMQLGIKYVESHGGLYNKAKIKLNEQPESGTQAALVSSSVRTLVNDNVKLLIGPTLSADCLAAANQIDAAGASSLIGCTTTSLTGVDRTAKNEYRFDTNDQLTSTALAAEVAKDYKDVKTVDIVAYDYVQGHQGVTTFMSALKSKGITPSVGKEFFVPAGTTNYQAQISALAQEPKSSNRLLVLLTWGSGYLNFIQQGTPLNLFDNYGAVLTTSMYYKTAASLKGKAPTVWNSYGTCYADVWKNDIMTWFTSNMQSTYKRLPDDWSTWGFNQVLVYAAAINKAKSTDPAKVNAALSNLSVETATGTQTMDPKTHQASRQVPVCKTSGDPSSPEGVKLEASSLFDSADLLK